MMNRTILPIIEVHELLKLREKAEDFILIDVSYGPEARSAYDKNHLEGAIFADLDTQLSEIKEDPAEGGRHPLPSLEKFSDSLSQLGIGVDDHVILYDRNFGALAAARFWWMLRSVGHEKVQVLNGGEFRLGEPFGDLVSLSMRSEVLFSAVEERLAECMADRGFRYEAMALQESAGEELGRSVMEVRQQDPDEVVGYGFSEWNAAQQPVRVGGGDTAESVSGEVELEVAADPTDPNAWVDELPEEEKQAWYEALGGLSAPEEEKESVTVAGGITKWAPDACLSKGEEAVYGPLADWYRAFYMVTEELPIEAELRLMADPVVADAIESWQSCMAEAGFEFSDFRDPIRRLQVRFPLGTDAAESVAAEAEMAPVDARCFQAADLPEVLGDAQREVEAELLAEHEGVVAAYVELHEAALVRARGEG